MKKSGFTLVELSIVLVIIGLIVGGVVGGQSLIRSAKQQSVIKEVNEIKVALTAFELQFDGIPGDFSEATDYWPSAGGVGNGDGVISQQNGDYGNANESQSAFEDLTLSGTYPGTYVDDGNPAEIGTGKEYPASAINGGGYAFSYYYFAQLWFSNAILLAGADSGDFRLDIPIVTAAQAYAFDKKIDDGIANKGLVRAIHLGGGNNPSACVTHQPRFDASSYAHTSTYLLDETDTNCGVYFLTK